MQRNLCYLTIGMALGAVLGVMVCDHTKKHVIETFKTYLAASKRLQKMQ